MLKILSGKKTYLGMMGLGLLGLCWSLGWIDDKTASVIGSIIGPMTGVAYRHAVAKGK